MASRFRAFACASALSVVALATPAFAAAAGPIVVDDDDAQCKKANFSTIQAAVTAAPAGSTIQVCAGTYVEQVTIPAGKDGLSLEAKGGGTATIKAPAVMADPKAIVRVNGAQNVTIRGFTISGPGGGPCDSIRYGVRVDGGGSATIEKNHITQIRDNPFSGCQNGNAIQVGRQFESQTATAEIRHNIIDNYQKSGIVVDNAGSHADIGHNTITGVGATPTIAQNGIQISRNATADVDNNTVTDNQYAPQTVASAGILLFQITGGVTLRHNTTLRNDEGVYLISADDVLVEYNDSHSNTFDGFGLDGVTDSRLTHNEANDNGLDGIWVGSNSTGNNLDHNRMDNNVDHDAHDDAPPGANSWEHNNCDTENQPGLCD